MSKIRTTLLAAAVLLAGCGGGGDAAPAGAVAAGAAGGAAAQATRLYAGVANTAARFNDAFGNPQVREYQLEVLVQVSAPLVAQFSQQIETNPVHFSVGPLSNAAIAAEGLYTIVSSVISFQGSPSSELLVQYWNIQLNGNQIAGTLANPQNALALSPNLINLPQALAGSLLVGVPFAIGAGSQFAGSVTEQEVRLRVEGNAIDGAHPFVSEIVAARAN